MCRTDSAIRDPLITKVLVEQPPATWGLLKITFCMSGEDLLAVPPCDEFSRLGGRGGLLLQAQQQTDHQFSPVFCLPAQLLRIKQIRLERYSLKQEVAGQRSILAQKLIQARSSQDKEEEQKMQKEQ